MSEEQDIHGQAPHGGPAPAGDESAAPNAAASSASVQPVAFGQLEPSQKNSQKSSQKSSQKNSEKSGESRNLDLLLDVEIPISVEVGRTSLSLEDVLNLVPGSVVGLGKKVEEPVDLRVNGKLVARGEVVLVDDSYGLRITQILDTAARIESLR